MFLNLLFALSLCGVAAAQSTLPGAAPLTAQGDLSMQMVDAISADLSQRTAAAAVRRSEFWKRNFRSRADYERSVAPNRERFRKIMGAVDARVPVEALHYVSSTASPALVGEGPGYKIFAVRWPVFRGVTGDGLLLQPDAPPSARVVALPDAGQTPEMLAGLAPGVAPEAQFARRLAENGCQVLVPTLIDRGDTWSGNPVIKKATNQPHREFIYRMAFEAGRHIIGYEVQKTLSAVDWFEHENRVRKAPIAVAGYGEGGLIAFWSAAADTRIEAALVSGYFSAREDLWKEPIYRDVWGLLREFGDAEIAGLVAPRTLIVETGAGPEIAGPPAETNDRKGATPNGSLSPPPARVAEAEIERARPFFAQLKAAGGLRSVLRNSGAAELLRAVGAAKATPSGSAPVNKRGAFDPSPRLRAQFEELIAYTQDLIRESPRRREQFWANADASTPERWKESTGFHRDYIWREVIGRMPDPTGKPNPRARQVYDTAAFRGYEVTLDVWPNIYAYGILLVPKNLRAGERRPVVVCQHGLEGRPADVADPAQDHRAYHAFAARLAEQGFVTFSPQNPYIGMDRFRIIQRKAHPLKLSLFSYILGQHQQILEWLSSLPFADPARIGFYGLSYGGKTAVRVPPFLDRYALSICSGDFNEWVWKTTSVDSTYSYMFTREYDMLEFDFANIVNYSDLANLMAPRPFMVERGHMDQVAPDEWVAYEFAKVRRFYDTTMNLPERARIEFFNGPHTINGKGTFEFLREFLRWPK